jgi:tripartite-type tricarboxylate transporter receptor subunit TctC
MQHVQSGRLKVLAVTGAKRSATMPNIPTVAELGLSGFDAKPWYGLLGPANLPENIVSRLNAATAEILNDPAIKQRLDGLGAEPMKMTPVEFQAFAAEELAKWTKVVKTSGATVD